MTAIIKHAMVKPVPKPATKYSFFQNANNSIRIFININKAWEAN